jgi:hypothetical protein
VKRRKKAWNALRVRAKTVAVLLIQEKLFAGEEPQEQQRFAEDHHGKSRRL